MMHVLTLLEKVPKCSSVVLCLDSYDLTSYTITLYFRTSTPGARCACIWSHLPCSCNIYWHCHLCLVLSGHRDHMQSTAFNYSDFQGAVCTIRFSAVSSQCHSICCLLVFISNFHIIYPLHSARLVARLICISTRMVIIFREWVGTNIPKKKIEIVAILQLAFMHAVSRQCRMCKPPGYV